MSKKIRISVIREKITKVTRILSGRGIRVTQSGMNAFVQYHETTLEPIRVNIPYLPDDATEELVSAIEGFVDHEVAHLLFTDQKSIIKAQAFKVQSLHNIIEDVFIERRMSKEFTGTAYNLNKMYHIFTTKFIEPKFIELKAKKEATELDWWHLLCACACRALGGQEHFELYMSDKWEYLPKVKEALLPFETRLLTTKDSWENLDLAIDIREAIYGKKEEPKPEEEKEEPEFDDEDSEPEDSEVEFDDDEESEVEEEKPEEKSESEEGESDEDTEFDDDEAETDDDLDEEIEDEDPTEESDADTDSTSSDSMEDEAGKEGFGGGESELGEDSEEGSAITPFESEDEDSSMAAIEDFDDGMSDLISEMAGDVAKESGYMPFTKDWDKVEKFPVPHSYRDEWATSIDNKVAGMTGTLQKGLERAFRAANKSRWESGKKTGRVNNAALSRLLNNDPRVFRTKQETKTKEVAVSILLDCSGSMSGSRINMATDTAWALSEVLSKLGINFEVLGFTTCDKEWHTDEHKGMADEMMEARKKGMGWSRVEPVYVPIFKGFDERWGVEQKRRTASIPRTLPLANNVDGESLEYASKRLLQQKEPGKTLIVLSDGAPCAQGDSYGFVNHLKEVVRDLEKKQVNVVGIGIQTNAVRDYYRKNVVINKLEDLPTTVLNKLRDSIMQK